MHRIVHRLLVSWSLLAVGAAAQEAGIRAGEVVVWGTPEQYPGVEVVKVLPHAGLTVVRVPAGQEAVVARVLRAAGRRAGVNRVAEAFGSVNDPVRSYQWHLDSVQADQAWDVTTGAGATVAVLDTGLATGGTDGVNACGPGIDIVNNDNEPYDGDGHGTHVSGTVSQNSNNSVGVAGLAFGACVLPVKVLSDSGSGSFADIADGIVWAVNNGADVINMSLGTNARFGVRSDPILDPALQYAESQGVVVVCAAGNDGNKRNVSYPAIAATTLAVGATDFRDRVVRYSNQGEGLDLVAPGGDVTRDDNGDGYGDGVLQETHSGGAFGYYFYQGTSMASPHVAAAAALLMAADPTLTPTQVRAALTGSARDLNDPGFDSSSGWGLLQVYAALTGGGGDPGGGGCTDNDNDGWCVEDGDCDDNNPNVYPGHNDTKGRWGRDGVDNDCNGIIDG